VRPTLLLILLFSTSSTQTLRESQMTSSPIITKYSHHDKATIVDSTINGESTSTSGDGRHCRQASYRCSDTASLPLRRRAATWWPSHCKPMNHRRLISPLIIASLGLLLSFICASSKAHGLDAPLLSSRKAPPWPLRGAPRGKHFPSLLAWNLRSHHMTIAL